MSDELRELQQALQQGKGDQAAAASAIGALQQAVDQATMLVAALVQARGGTIRVPRNALERARGKDLTTRVDQGTGELVLMLRRPTPQEVNGDGPAAV